MKSRISHRLALALLGALLTSEGPARAEPLLQVDDSRGLDGALTIETDEWKLVFSSFFNGGIHQWYDLTFDPGETDNLTTASGEGSYNTGTLFDYDVYTGFGFNQINEFMTTVGRNASPGALEFELLENTPARVRILQSGHPRLNNGTGPPGDPFVELEFVEVSTIWTLYPTGRVGIEFRADRNPGAEIVDSGPGGAGKGVERLPAPFENRVSATGGTDFSAVFATAGDTIESPGGGWGPLHIVQRVSPTQLILEQDIPAGTHDFVIRRDEVRLETISIHADGDPTIVSQCSDPAVSRWQGGSDGNPLWSTPQNDGCGTLNAGTGQNLLLAHWTRDRGAGSLLAFYEPWVEQTSGFFNDTGFTDISYTQAGRAGFWSFEPHHRHFLAQMGSSTGTVLPTIKSVADAQPYADDYRNPFAEALVGTLATGPEIATHGFNPGTAAYEVTATADVAVVRFDATGDDRAGFAYFEPAVLLRGYDVEDARVSVEISGDGGSTFAPLAPSLYNLTTRDEEAELGANTRLFQYLGEIPGTATGASAVALRFSEDPSPGPGTTVMCASFQRRNVVVPYQYLASYLAAGYSLGACSMPPTTVMCAVLGTNTQSVQVTRDAIAIRQGQAWTLGECVTSSTTAMCNQEVATYLVPDALVPRYETLGLTIGECTMAPTTPMCPPQGAPTYIVPRNTIPLRENLGWMQGECGTP